MKLHTSYVGEDYKISKEWLKEEDLGLLISVVRFFQPFHDGTLRFFDRQHLTCNSIFYETSYNPRCNWHGMWRYMLCGRIDGNMSLRG